MSKEEIIKLMVNSSNDNPYSGKLPKTENYLAAIDLANLCKDFAEKGQIDESMDIPVEDWIDVIRELKLMEENERLKAENEELINCLKIVVNDESYLVYDAVNFDFKTFRQLAKNLLTKNK